MHPTNCLNCATLLTADDHYCPTCGQKTDTHRLSMKHVWHDLSHALTHADKGFFFTLKELLVNPGKVSREYVAGMRKKYYNPLSLLVIIVGIQLVANGIFKPFSQDTFSPEPTSTIQHSESKRIKFEKIIERRREMGKFIDHHTNIVLFISTPFLAFIFSLFYRRKYNYAEHLSTVAYVNSFLSVLTILIFGPLLYYLPGRSLKEGVYFVMIFTHLLYMAYMYYGFVSYPARSDYFKALGVSIVALLAWTILSGLIGFIYILGGVL
ncbi:MAG TPA: DUF3667 domain-containing protein [Chitinophagaceae bacterium]|nr:DUF3667 domain-containing protein [Chitinophagaceae bacterium]